MHRFLAPASLAVACAAIGSWFIGRAYWLLGHRHAGWQVVVEVVVISVLAFFALAYERPTPSR